MNSQIKVSVIIPVFNTGNYLRQCVESVLYQTYQNFEIILVNDGSTDNSLIKCEELQEEYPLAIKLINQSNQGLSCARNVGLLNSVGQYVMFLDSDDFWSEKTVLEILINMLLLDNIDFIMFNANYFTEGKYKSIFNYPADLKNIQMKNKFTLLIKSGNGAMSACMKIIKRDFLLKNNILFIPRIKAEDSPWFIDLILSTDKFVAINNRFYNYRQGVKGSITNSIDIGSFNNYYKIHSLILDKANQTEGLKLSILSFLAYLYVSQLGLYWKLSVRDRKNVFEDIKCLSSILDFDEHPRVKLVRKFYKLFGFKATLYALLLYKKVK